MGYVSASLKYAVVERERRYILASMLEGVTSTKGILDRYVTGTRLRLREVREEDGTVTRKRVTRVRRQKRASSVLHSCSSCWPTNSENSRSCSAAMNFRRTCVRRPTPRESSSLGVCASTPRSEASTKDVTYPPPTLFEVCSSCS